MKCDFTQNLKLMARRLYMPKAFKVLVVLLLSLAAALPAAAQGNAFSVTGRVTDAATGEGLPGVTVLLKGSSTAAPTNAEGAYTINLPDGNGTLIFSYIGYTAQEVPVNNRSTIDVKMGADAKALGEVVVVGYGTQRQEAVTGSVASIGGDVLREVPSANISQALQGRLPGVEFTQSSSQPGSAMQIRIRGTRSLTATNDPLVVLDGIPFAGSIGDINPNDIKSIDILKDASATAIYGSRGANGVILVTTKTGQIGQKPQVSYNSFVGAKSVFAKYPMMEGPEFAALRKAAGQYNNALDESDDVNTDWQDLLYRTGMMTSHDLGISGGTEQGRYNFSAGYFEDEGVVPTQQYKRYSIRGALDQGVGNNFRFGFTTYNNYSVSEGSNVGLYNILSMSPIANPYNEDGTLKRTIRMPLDEQWLFTRDMLDDIQDKWLSETRALGSYNTLYGELKIPGVEGLKYRANLGLNYRQSHGGSYTGEGINSATATTPSTASLSNARTTDWTIENLLTYDRTFGGKHNVNVVGLYSASESQYDRTRITARDIPADAFQFYNLGQSAGEITVLTAPEDYWKSGLLSWMGRAMYSYDDRYMVSATVRSDGSSRLAPGYKWHTYPAVSVGWNIARESFMQDITLVNMLKLRAGYGQTSNQAVSPYATLGRLGTRPYNFGPDNYQTGLYVTEIPNPGLGWEFSKTWNYGLDFAILNNRLSGTVEYYVTNTEDILLRLNLPPTAGVNTVVSNIGETQNKGLELSLNGVILEDVNGWTWEAGVNVYGNRNKVVALASGQERDEANWWFVGQPINVIYDYERIGLWQEEDPHRDILEPGGNAGMIKVKYTGDYNADGTPVRQIGPQDRQILDVNPDLQGGFNTRVSYKGFDLSAVGAFQSGGTLISTLYSSSGYLNMMSGRRNNVKVDYWTPENTDARYPKPGGIASGDNPKYGSTLGYFDASYLKVRTISLGYNFSNSNWLQNVGVNNLRVYVTAQNPFVMFSPYHKESGMDPETNSYGNENAAVTTAYQPRLLTIGTNSPATRNYLVGLNVTF
ncbi:SusC/RagA family TonB-linked outer membrane protein [Pontibacter roseus]|uniref:SusC/RagA family TonB-linked outer membrane protein n=1 Tax=Pontibacter roseus TaxID=336989 RepID=UPI00038289AD|nr:TonB-dependent receptor [Pontibacter roseus]